VKNLENLQGDEVDFLIVGPTFGPTESGKFTKRFGRIDDHSFGYRYLNVLFSRARRHVHVVASIPPSEFMNAGIEREEGGRLSGSSFLYGYLRYASAISARDPSCADGMLAEFSMENAARQCEEVMSTVEKTIGNHFKKRYPKYANMVTTNVSTNSLLNGTIIRFPKGKCMVLEANTYESYSSCIYRKNILESFGYSCYHIWLKSWLNSPSNELSKLSQVVDDVMRKNCVVEVPAFVHLCDESSSPIFSPMMTSNDSSDKVISGLANKRPVVIEIDDADSSDVEVVESKAIKRQKLNSDGTPWSL